MELEEEKNDKAPKGLSDLIENDSMDQSTRELIK